VVAEKICNTKHYSMVKSNFTRSNIRDLVTFNLEKQKMPNRSKESILECDSIYLSSSNRDDIKLTSLRSSDREEEMTDNSPFL